MTTGGKEKKSGAVAAQTVSTNAGRRRALYLFFIFLFLAAGGAYIWYAMRGAAYELSGIGKNRLLSANSALGTVGSFMERGGNFFASEEDLSQPPGKDGKRLMLASSAAPEKTGAQNFFHSNADAEEGVEAVSAMGAAQGGVPIPALRATSLQDKLQAKQSVLSGANGGQVSNTSSSGGDLPSVVAAGGAGLGKGGQNKDSGPSVLNSLKSAFKSSMYGMRVTSQDAARTWVSNAFTPTPEAEHSLQYSDAMRSKLDKINSQSIPGFLREQDLSATGVKTLRPSTVSPPDLQKNLTAKALKNDSQYQKDKAAGGSPSGGGGGGESGGGESGGGSGGGSRAGGDSMSQGAVGNMDNAGAMASVTGETASNSIPTTNPSSPQSIPGIQNHVNEDGVAVPGVSATTATGVDSKGNLTEWIDEGMYTTKDKSGAITSCTDTVSNVQIEPGKSGPTAGAPSCPSK